MKTYLQKLIRTAVLGLALCANHMPAWAGFTLSSEVYLSGSNSRGGVEGSPTGARYSLDSKQYLNCSAYSFAGAGGQSVFCEAADRSDRRFLCISTDSRFVDAVKGMTPSSYLYITRNGSTCTNLEIDNASDYLR